jgi:2-polyprenyl-3-methyl-5-hydroxy-6-metoxy-1,4-benzoquinol methylase
MTDRQSDPSEIKIPMLAHPKTHAAVLELIRRRYPHPTGVKVLDLGAGAGAMSRALLRMGFDVTPADLFPENFMPAEPKCRRVHCDETFPFDDQQFDCVVSIEVIEHLERQFDFAREINRILKPGGLLVLTTPNILNLASRLKYLLSGFYSLVSKPINEYSGTKLHDHIAPATYYQVRYILHTNGLRIRTVTTDRYRRSSTLLLGPLWPCIKAATRQTTNREKEQRQREANEEIRRHMTGLPLLLGRTLIVEAEKVCNQSLSEK